MQPIAFLDRLELAFRRVWFRLKALLGQNLKTDKNFLAGNAALRFSKGIIPPGTRITCAGRADGAGKQAWRASQASTSPRRSVRPTSTAHSPG